MAKNVEVEAIYGQKLCDNDNIKNVDVLVFLVPHKYYREFSQIDVEKFINKSPNSMVIDMKNVLDPSIKNNKLIRF